MAKYVKIKFDRSTFKEIQRIYDKQFTNSNNITKEEYEFIQKIETKIYDKMFNTFGHEGHYTKIQIKIMEIVLSYEGTEQYEDFLERNWDNPWLYATEQERSECGNLEESVLKETELIEEISYIIYTKGKAFLNKEQKEFFEKFLL